MLGIVVDGGGPAFPPAGRLRTLMFGCFGLAAVESAFYFLTLFVFVWINRLFPDFSACGSALPGASGGYLWAICSACLLQFASVALALLLALRILRDSVTGVQDKRERFARLARAVFMLAIVTVSVLFAEEAALLAGAPLLEADMGAACLG